MAEQVSEMLNEVSIVGRVVHQPSHRVLPSGDEVVTCRVSIPRPDTPERRPGVDWVDCAAWNGRTRRVVGSWRPGDIVAVSGSLRRRMFRVAGATTSRVEVEVSTARRVRKADRQESARAAPY